MNVYLMVHPYEIRCVLPVLDDGTGPIDEYMPYDVIFAETRGKARAQFCKLHKLEWTERILCRLLAKGLSSDGSEINEHGWYTEAQAKYRIYHGDIVRRSANEFERNIERERALGWRI